MSEIPAIEMIMARIEGENAEKSAQERADRQMRIVLYALVISLAVYALCYCFNVPTFTV